MKQAVPLPPIGASGAAAGAPWNGGTSELPAPPEDYQETVRDENRRRLAAEQAESLTPRKRPVSANKKFLSKYGLSQSKGLFAP